MSVSPETHYLVTNEDGDLFEENGSILFQDIRGKI